MSIDEQIQEQPGGRSGVPAAITLLHLAAAVLFYGILRRMVPDDFLFFETTVGVSNLMVYFSGAAGLYLFLAHRHETATAKAFAWLPLILTLLFTAIMLIAPAITWWAGCILSLMLWLSCSTHLAVVHKFPRLGLLAVMLDVILICMLFLDFHYYSITRAHISLQHIFVVLIGMIGRRELSQFLKIIGISPQHALALIAATIMIAVAAIAAMRLKKPENLVSELKPGRILLGFLLLPLIWAAFSPVAALVPFSDYFKWRLNNGFFSLPERTHLALMNTPEKLFNKENRLDFSLSSRQGDYQWGDTASKTSIVFIFIESWRPDALDYMPFTRELASSGLWLKNHQGTTNDSLGGTTAVYYSIVPFLGPNGFANFFRPSTWISFLQKSGYSLKRISDVGVTLVYPDYGYVSIEEAEKQHAISPPPGLSRLNSGRTLQILLHELKKPGPKILEGVLYDTHYNYTFPQEFARHQPVVAFDSDFIASGYDEAAMVGLTNRYRNACGYIDHELASFFAQVREQNLDENTVFVVLGDHGECLGEDGQIFHATGPHINQFRTSVVMVGPMIQPAIATSPTAHEDIIPTLNGFMGIKSANTTGEPITAIVRDRRLQYDISTNRRLIVRGPRHMSLFMVNNDGTLPWLATTRNNFTIDAELMALYQQDRIAELCELVDADRKAVVSRFHK